MSFVRRRSDPTRERVERRRAERQTARVTASTALAEQEDWIVVGAVDAPAFQGSWSNEGAPYYDVAFMLDTLGWVHFRGALDPGGDGTVAFTLPVEYRPTAEVQMTARGSAAGTPQAVIVEPDGEVRIGLSGPPSRVHLDGLQFMAEQ